MSLPSPTPGLVVRHYFLWSHEAAAGLVEGRKARPVMIVAATPKPPFGLSVIVAPVTHSPPLGADGMELPSAVASHLKLDAGPHFVRFDELNQFIWPGADLARVHLKSDLFAYGIVPQPLYEHIRRGVIETLTAGRMKAIVNRDEG